MKSDYGQRNNILTNQGNTGLSIGIVHFFNFSYNAKKNAFFNEHFKIRTELSFNKIEFSHFGKWVENRSSLASQQLLAMKGKTSLINLGMQLEFSPFKKICDYERNEGSFSPYLSLGLQYSFYNTKNYSTLGELGTPETTLNKYLSPSDGRPNGFSNENNLVWSLIYGFGTHYKLTRMSDLMVETRFQFFNSDWIDGLNPNKQTYTENKYNDMQVWLSFGYIYYL